MSSGQYMDEKINDLPDMVAKAEAYLEASLSLLDEARLYDVAAHVDLALHILRGTRVDPRSLRQDIPS
jgi:hypothetical protein